MLSQNRFLIQPFKAKKNSDGKGLGVSCVKTFFGKIIVDFNVLMLYMKIKPAFCEVGLKVTINNQILCLMLVEKLKRTAAQNRNR